MTSPTPSPITNGFEEKAREIADKIVDGKQFPTRYREIVSAIAKALEEAVREEREECAKIVDKHEEASREIGFSDAADSAKWLATAIRSRED